MDEKKYSATEYEKMPHFKNDFPGAKSPEDGGPRVCQVGSYNCVIDRLITQNKNEVSLINPTGTGKSDLFRAVSLGLTVIRKRVAGVWAFSPNLALRSQLKSDGVNEFFSRLNYRWSRPNYPFVEVDDLAQQRFRDGAVMESFTVQYLITNLTEFLRSAEKLRRDTGRFPAAVFDECHLYSDKNEWGDAAIRLREAGVPIINATGTAHRSDNTVMPAFRTKLVEGGKRSYIKTTYLSDVDSFKVRRGKQKFEKYELEADYEYTYERAWLDGIILKPNPIGLDAKEESCDKFLSDMSITQSQRLLRKFLTDKDTIRDLVGNAVESIRLRKLADSAAAAIVVTLSDDDDGSQEFSCADYHANLVKNEFSKQAPDLRVLVVTSKTNAEDGLARFRADAKYDVLIVKAMGTIGFNCPRIKTVVHMSNVRTMAAFVQLVNRGCRHFGGLAQFDLILPRDRQMQDIWSQFIYSHRLTIEATTEDVVESEELIENDRENGAERSQISWTDYERTFDLSQKRSEADKIIEMMRKKLPDLANKLNNQEMLNHFERMKQNFGADWLENFEMAVVPQMSLLDPNEEEARLRMEAASLVKAITKEILNVTGRAYSAELWGDIKRRVWTRIKRDCRFSPNQSIDNLSGIENYQKIIEKGAELRELVFALPDDLDDFDYAFFLNRR